MAADLQHLDDMLFSPISPIDIVKKEPETFPEEELDRLTDLIQGNTNFPGDLSCSGWSTMLKSDCLWVASGLGGRGKKGDFVVNQWEGCALPPLPPKKQLISISGMHHHVILVLLCPMSNGYINHKYYDDDSMKQHLHNLCMSTALIDNYSISWKTSTGLDT